MLRFIYLFALLLIFQNEVKGEGMIQVFEWAQMDFYNRGGGGGGGVNNPSGNVGSKPNIGGDGKIIFPSQLWHYRNKRQKSKITSRDDIPKTDTRFGAQMSNINRNSASNSSYIPENNVPMGVTHYNGRLFVTLPRRRTGIPSTVNYVDLRKDGNKRNPKLHAYPNFETNQFNMNSPNTNTIVSVYRTTADECGRLWFVDTGMLEYPNNRIQLQRPAIWIIDLKTDRVLHRFEISQDVVETGRGLASITVDVLPHACNAAFAYLPDLLNSRLYVFSLAENRLWTFTHNYFNFDPLAGDLNIGGQTFRWDDGIFSITLGPRKNGERQAYFHAMASNNEFVVSNKVLQNETNAARSEHGNDFRVLGSRGVNKQSTMHSYDPRTASIFYSEIQQNGIGCWNTNQPFGPENHDTVARDDQRMIYPSDLSIDDEGTMWVMTNSLPIFIYSTLDPNVGNFRVWKQNVFEAVKNTKCYSRY